MVFLWVLHFIAWPSGKKLSTSPSDAWALILALGLGCLFYSNSGGVTACVAAWVPFGLGSMILTYAQKGLEKQNAKFFSGGFLLALLTALLTLAGMVAFNPGQNCWRQKKDFPLQHAFNLLRPLDRRTVLFMEDAFEAAACREALLMEPLRSPVVLLDVPLLDQRWYASQYFSRVPELLWPALSTSPWAVMDGIVKSNQDDWNLQWGLSQAPVSWSGSPADPTVLTLLFKGKGRQGTLPEQAQYRLDLSSLPQGNDSDPLDRRYLERYALGFEALGRYLLSQNSFSLSIKTLERSANLDPNREEPRALLDQIYSQNNVIEAARLEMEKTVKDHPGRIRTLMALLEEAQKKGEEPRTVALLDEMIRLNSELSDAEYHLSLIYDKLGYPEKSKVMLEASVQLNPQKVDAQLSYGKKMARLGNRLNAEEAFRSVLAVDPVNKEAQVELWKLLNQP
jgi:tetratricopeptide (TPR) repeat protein